MKKKLAIIGAAIGQFPLCKKAKSMGLETYCFAYEQGAYCKDIVDHFYPISIFEMDKIIEKCKELKIDGVVSNASDVTAEVVAYISGKLGLPGPDYRSLIQLRDKYYVRTITNQIEGLDSPLFYKYEGEDKKIYPCVVKPCKGGAKKGVSFVSNVSEFNEAVRYATIDSDTEVIVEQFIDGIELSVECISFKRKHYILQITDKDVSSAPHFVELGHHQPANLSDIVRNKIHNVIPQLLSVIGYDNGASHIELKYHGTELYLIEANLRGGGDCISNSLVFLSSGIDYLKCMIDITLNQFVGLKQTGPSKYAGIYYLCKQTEDLLHFFEKSKSCDWVVEEQIYSTELVESHSNYERNGYLIYQSDHKIIP